MEELIIKDINGNSYNFDEMVTAINNIICSKSYTQRNNEFDIYDTKNNKHINIFVNSCNVILNSYTGEILKNRKYYENDTYIKFLYYLLDVVYF